MSIDRGVGSLLAWESGGDDSSAREEIAGKTEAETGLLLYKYTKGLIIYDDGARYCSLLRVKREKSQLG